MVNAGASVTTSLLGEVPGERQEHMLGGRSRFAGEDLEIDEAVYEAERRTGDRNRAIAYLMRTFGMLEEQVDAAVEMTSVSAPCWWTPAAWRPWGRRWPTGVSTP